MAFLPGLSPLCGFPAFAPYFFICVEGFAFSLIPASFSAFLCCFGHALPPSLSTTLLPCQEVFSSPISSDLGIFAAGARTIDPVRSFQELHPSF